MYFTFHFHSNRKYGMDHVWSNKDHGIHSDHCWSHIDGYVANNFQHIFGSRAQNYFSVYLHSHTAASTDRAVFTEICIYHGWRPPHQTLEYRRWLCTFIYKSYVSVKHQTWVGYFHRGKVRIMCKAIGSEDTGFNHRIDEYCKLAVCTWHTNSSVR